MADYKEGFLFKEFKFGWENKKLYRLPCVKNDRSYSLREIPLIKLSKTGQGYRLIRVKKSIAQVRALTKKVDWKLTNNCVECL